MSLHIRNAGVYSKVKKFPIKSTSFLDPKSTWVKLNNVWVKGLDNGNIPPGAKWFIAGGYTDNVGFWRGYYGTMEPGEIVPNWTVEHFVGSGPSTGTPLLYASVLAPGSSYGSVFPTGYTKLDFIDDRDHTKKVTYSPSDITGWGDALPYRAPIGKFQIGVKYWAQYRP